MINLMIIDDEPIVRQRLRETIDWEAIGCQIVAEASDGFDALQQYEKYSPDIIITDIMMNGADGLDFITTIRENDKYVELIILTGYENFSFAKHALENQVSAYILKPIQNEVIINAVVSARKKIEKKRMEKAVIDAHTGNMHWQSFLDVLVNNSNAETACRENSIDPHSGRYSVGVLWFPHADALKGADDIIHETVNYCANVNRMKAYTKKISHNETAILAFYGDADSDRGIYDMLTDVKNQLKRHLDTDAQISASGVFHNILMIKRAYKQARKGVADYAAVSEGDTRGKEASIDDYSPLIQKAIEYIEANYNHNVNIDNLATELFVSRRTLMRKFKQETGKTVGEHITYHRISIAVELVKKGDLKITEIAFKVGYNDMKHFYEIFKKVTGHSPKHYRGTEV
ncbi:MAG: response regulator [Clostridia bacterium]|nr:response regulator [Clostridia bacterium]